MGPLVEQIRGAIAAARHDATGITGELRIGALTLAATGSRFSDIVREFKVRHPACDVTVFEAFPGEVLPRLRRGDLEILVHWLPVVQDDLTVGPIVSRERRMLAVPIGHPPRARVGNCGGPRRLHGHRRGEHCAFRDA